MKPCSIILNYFTSGDTIACVRMLAEQQAGMICVVENSGDDRERAALAAALSGMPQVTLMATPRNLGFAGGMNFALQELLSRECDSFLLLNNDIVLPPGFFALFMAEAEKSGLDIASPVINCHPEQHRLWSRGMHYNRWTGLLSQTKSVLPGDVFYLPGCCLLVRRSVFEKTGLLDSSFFMYGEDVEFCWRAGRLGFKIGVVPQACMYHKAGASSVQNSLFYETSINRGHLLLAEKLFASAPARLSARCVKLGMLFLRACLRTARYKNGNALRGYAAALFDIGGT